LLVGVPVINFKSSEPSRLSWCSLEAEEAEKCCSFGETEFGGGVGDIEFGLDLIVCGLEFGLGVRSAGGIWVGGESNSASICVNACSNPVTKWWVLSHEEFSDSTNIREKERRRLPLLPLSRVGIFVFFVLFEGG
tara:strand:- start:47 stop:451 length:405 start_codon:yes stop_codon:yes gene_type:complete